MQQNPAAPPKNAALLVQPASRIRALPMSGNNGFGPEVRRPQRLFLQPLRP